MLSDGDYLLVWTGYAVAALVVMAAWWRLTSWLPVWLRDPLRAIALVVLAMPALVDPERGHYAPALFVSAFELATAADGGGGAVIGVRLLLGALLAVLAAWTLRLLCYLLVGRRRAQRAGGVS